MISANNLPIYLQNFTIQFEHNSGRVSYANVGIIPTENKFARSWNLTVSAVLLQQQSRNYVMTCDFSKVILPRQYVISFTGPVQGVASLGRQKNVNIQRFVNYTYDSLKKILMFHISMPCDIVKNTDVLFNLYMNDGDTFTSTTFTLNILDSQQYPVWALSTLTGTTNLTNAAPSTFLQSSNLGLGVWNIISNGSGNFVISTFASLPLYLGAGNSAESLFLTQDYCDNESECAWVVTVNETFPYDASIQNNSSGLYLVMTQSGGNYVMTLSLSSTTTWFITPIYVSSQSPDTISCPPSISYQWNSGSQIGEFDASTSTAKFVRENNNSSTLVNYSTQTFFIPYVQQGAGFVVYLIGWICISPSPSYTYLFIDSPIQISTTTTAPTSDTLSQYLFVPVFTAISLSGSSTFYLYWENINDTPPVLYLSVKQTNGQVYGVKDLSLAVENLFVSSYSPLSTVPSCS
jgi:hypothetical protein